MKESEIEQRKGYTVRVKSNYSGVGGKQIDIDEREKYHNVVRGWK